MQAQRTVWTILKILQWTQQYFSSKGVENPRLDAEVLLCAVLDKSRIQLYTNFDEPLEEQELKQYRGYVARRAAREPVAYILGHKGFLQYDFKVTQDTLIPRPETELLVEQLVSLTKDRGPLRILDLGCGSGILSIAALRLGAESAFACDIDEKCVDVAYENAALNGIGKDRYTVRWGDVLTDAALRQEMGAGYDIVVANIVADVIMGLSPHVRPFLKPDGLFLCSGIIDDRAAEVLEKLKADGWDVFEQRSSEGWFSYLCK